MKDAREVGASARNDFLVALREFNDSSFVTNFLNALKDAEGASSGRGEMLFVAPILVFPCLE
jgi:hypothetical protein